jgi:hypothetical protein
MFNSDIAANWEFLDPEKAPISPADSLKLISESIIRYLISRFDWQKDSEELIRRQNEFVITAEMINAQKSPKKSDKPDVQQTAPTPPRVINLLREMR